MKTTEFQELSMRELVDVDGGEYEPYLMMDQLQWEVLYWEGLLLFLLE